MMRTMTLSELLQPLSAQLLGADVAITGVCTDSRAVRAGDLFVAFRGEHFDGHDYLSQAQRDGAAAALVVEPVAWGASAHTTASFIAALWWRLPVVAAKRVSKIW